MAEMAKLTCLIREKTTTTFAFMEHFLLKAERMNLRFGDLMIRKGRKWKEGIILELQNINVFVITVKKIRNLFVSFFLFLFSFLFSLFTFHL